MGTATASFKYFFSLAGKILNGVRLLSLLLGLFECVGINLQEIINIIHMREKLMGMKAKKSVVHFLNNWASVYYKPSYFFLPH